MYPLEVAPRQGGKKWNQVSRYLSLAFLLPAAVFIGYVMGAALDHWLGTTYLYLVFLILGIVAGFVELIRTLQKEL